MTPQKETILIVDDEVIIRKLLLRRLSSEGYQCHEAGSADQALDELARNPIQLVILDIKMPGRSGVELLPEIRDTYPDTAIIMATGLSDAGVAVGCMRQGAYDYIAKPFNLEDVILSVGRALEKKRLEHENKDYQQHLEQRVEEQARRIRASFLNSISSLAYALEARDKYTSGHSERVAEVAVIIAKELDIPSEDIEKVRLAGLIHDIGKIGVREAILNKIEALTKWEFEHIKYHCEIGEHILTPIVEDEEILKMVRHHHERYDGTGYPDGLKAEQIPLGSRILAVADTYDAIISERPYRTERSTANARAEIESNKGTQFDPEVVQAFLRGRNLVEET
ncbi:HD domain-containing phosphohydrolase [Chloroflexota bacterium]